MTNTKEPVSYIAESQRQERCTHWVWGLGLCLGLLHGCYFGFPLMPCAAARRFFPLLAWLPPLFSLAYAVPVLVLVRRRWQKRKQDEDFVPVPPVETPGR